MISTLLSVVVIAIGKFIPGEWGMIILLAGGLCFVILATYVVVHDVTSDG